MSPIEESFLPECDYCVRITHPAVRRRKPYSLCATHLLYSIAWMIIKGDVKRKDSNYYQPDLVTVERLSNSKWFKEVTGIARQTATFAQIEAYIAVNWENGVSVVDYMTGIHPTVYEALINRKD